MRYNQTSNHLGAHTHMRSASLSALVAKTGKLACIVWPPLLRYDPLMNVCTRAFLVQRLLHVWVITWNSWTTLEHWFAPKPIISSLSSEIEALSRLVVQGFLFKHQQNTPLQTCSEMKCVTEDGKETVLTCFQSSTTIFTKCTSRADMWMTNHFTYSIAITRSREKKAHHPTGDIARHMSRTPHTELSLWIRLLLKTAETTRGSRSWLHKSSFLWRASRRRLDVVSSHHASICYDFSSNEKSLTNRRMQSNHMVDGNYCCSALIHYPCPKTRKHVKKH